jgi:hypothetical protein
VGDPDHPPLWQGDTKVPEVTKRPYLITVVFSYRLGHGGSDDHDQKAEENGSEEENQIAEADCGQWRGPDPPNECCRTKNDSAIPNLWKWHHASLKFQPWGWQFYPSNARNQGSGQQNGHSALSSLSTVHYALYIEVHSPVDSMENGDITPWQGTIEQMTLTMGPVNYQVGPGISAWLLSLYIAHKKWQNLREMMWNLGFWGW